MVELMVDKSAALLAVLLVALLVDKSAALLVVLMVVLMVDQKAVQKVALLAALMDTVARSSTSSVAQKGRCSGIAAHTAPENCLRVVATCRNQQHSVRCRCCRSSKWRAIVRRCKSRKQSRLLQRSHHHCISCRKIRQS